MNKNLIYRGPEPSHATRTISRRSRASLRGSMVAKLPGFPRPRILQFESALEYAFLCLTLVRDDIQHIWDQPPVVHYAGADGRLIHAAANQFGLVIELTLAAIEQAFLSGTRQLASKDFAQAYHLRTACDDSFNPFITPDFYRVDARQVFSREKR